MPVKERVYLVDEKDNVVGEKWRNDLNDSDRWRIIVVWVTNSDGEILIQQRSLDKSINPGLWSPAVVGTVVKGETYEQSAYKELEEEIGVKGATLKLRKVSNYKSSFGFRNVHVYECVINKPASDFEIQKEEVVRVQWITPADLSRQLRESPENFTNPKAWEEAYGFKMS